MKVRFPRPLFTRSELWFHGLTMPLLFPVGNYLYLGDSFFVDPAVFGWGLLQSLFLYTSSVVLLTIVVKNIYQWYPGVQQVRQRYAFTLLAISTITVGMVILPTWLYSLFPVFKTPFSWATVRMALWLGAAFDVLLCLVLGIQYSYGRWQENQTEKEQLKRAALQQDYDALKQQVNPHFLFNSLTSLSVLIEQNQQQAIEFLNHLATAYRYLLNSPNQSFTTLEAEMAFIDSYAYLLKTRYQSAISIRITGEFSKHQTILPPLSLQLIIDHAILYNILSVRQPLIILIEVSKPTELRVQYNRQPRSVRFRPGSNALQALATRYESMPGPGLVITEDAEFVTIFLPLTKEAIF